MHNQLSSALQNQSYIGFHTKQVRRKELDHNEI